ncbi:hypothetical protein L9F63_009101, partial [Diploptera punctata]
YFTCFQRENVRSIVVLKAIYRICHLFHSIEHTGGGWKVMEGRIRPTGPTLLNSAAFQLPELDFPSAYMKSLKFSL